MNNVYSIQKTMENVSEGGLPINVQEAAKNLVSKGLFSVDKDNIFGYVHFRENFYRFWTIRFKLIN